MQYLRQDVPRWPKRALQDLLTDALRWVGGLLGLLHCSPGFTRCAQQRWWRCFCRCKICLLSAHAGMENAATCWPSCTACSARDLCSSALFPLRSKPWSMRQLKVLDQINGAESVMDAVARVNNLVQQPTMEAAEVAAVLEQVGSSATVGGEVAEQQGEQQTQPSPRTVARSLSNSFRRPPPLPLPPPPRGRADAVQWDAWQAPDSLASGAACRLCDVASGAGMRGSAAAQPSVQAMACRLPPRLYPLC